MLPPNTRAVGQHCARGNMLLKVTVLDEGCAAPAPGPAPVPVPMPGRPESDSARARTAEQDVACGPTRLFPMWRILTFKCSRTGLRCV